MGNLRGMPVTTVQEVLLLKLIYKIFSTPRTVIDAQSFICDDEVLAVGRQVEEKVKKLFRGSLAIRAVDAGSTNACEQELTALGNAYYDIERFGIHFVASPRHADMLMVTGAVSRNMKEALIRTYEATPDPKIVVAVGDDAIDGGIFKGSYGVLDGVHNVIPVDFQIPGDPPSPKTIICHLLKILEALDSQTKNKNA
jgi:Ni,Fe-hydrogenase III small subunit